MTVNDLLPWLILLLVPCTVILFKVNTQLATLEAVQRSHGARLEQLDGIKA